MEPGSNGVKHKALRPLSLASHMRRVALNSYVVYHQAEA